MDLDEVRSEDNFPAGENLIVLVSFKLITSSERTMDLKCGPDSFESYFSID